MFQMSVRDNCLNCPVKHEDQFIALSSITHTLTTERILHGGERKQCGPPRRKCGPVVRTLALRSGVPGFKTHSDHLLNLFLVVPGSVSRPHL